MRTRTRPRARTHSLYFYKWWKSFFRDFFARLHLAVLTKGKKSFTRKKTFYSPSFCIRSGKKSGFLFTHSARTKIHSSRVCELWEHKVCGCAPWTILYFHPKFIIIICSEILYTYFLLFFLPPVPCATEKIIQELQILKALVLGEEERGQSQYQVMCFVTRLSKGDFISTDAMSKLRQVWIHFFMWHFFEIKMPKTHTWFFGSYRKIQIQYGNPKKIEDEKISQWQRG